MARFTETDQAARLLQQILAMPSTTSAPVLSDDLEETWASAYATDASKSAPVPTPFAHTTAPVNTAPLSASLSGGDAGVREMVATRAEQAELTLRVTPQPAANKYPGLDGETVGSFFRRVVRPYQAPTC
ncbi:MAG: hypothetical protein NZ585_12500 [Chloracidobacterium sp.]|nr:hypothetical protein [Chloracidobacterium sp.]MDW8216246.1 hypothetical protein [Acidobacteriota bacterium]